MSPHLAFIWPIDDPLMLGRPLRSLLPVAAAIAFVAIGLVGDAIRASELVHVGALLVAAAGLAGLALAVPRLVWLHE